MANQNLLEPAGSRAAFQAITVLKGVGPQIESRLARLGIRAVQDVLFHLPLRYQDRTRFSPMGGLTAGSDALVTGVIELSGVRMGRRRSLVSVISDNTGTITMRQFRFTATQQRSLARGGLIQCFGEVRQGPTGLEMVHPEYRLLHSESEATTEQALTAVYPTTDGVGQRKWRDMIRQALPRCATEIEELLPKGVGVPGMEISLADALTILHCPPVGTDPHFLMQGSHPARQRLAFEEMLSHHIAIRQRRSHRDRLCAPLMPPSTKLWPQLCEQLHFPLTSAQARVVEEVFNDLAGTVPTMRLVQGDVGSGKTVVAAAAVLAAVEAGCQAVVMAPTELLARQHFDSFETWLQGLGIDAVWLTSRAAAATRRQACQRLANGDVQVGIGTHALFQDDVHYHNLGLVVVDEQHRFGVEQRLALRDKGRSDNRAPHQLVMTATPIPRSLAMVMYADMDVSVIDEMPPGRQPVETVVIPNSRRQAVQERIRESCARGMRAYWVCPLIDESELLDLEAVTQRAESLRQDLPELKIELLHGRNTPTEKDVVMNGFRSGQVDLLVATTVIEVGVDVPEASLMVIENAERLGLAQLHQLRGRVGRGDQKSACVLMYQAPLGERAKARLSTMRETNDGFEIAQKDLELRGPGELLGTRQSGLPQFRIADLTRDHTLLQGVRDVAAQLLENGETKLIDRLIRRWLRTEDGFYSA